MFNILQVLNSKCVIKNSHTSTNAKHVIKQNKCIVYVIQTSIQVHLLTM